MGNMFRELRDSIERFCLRGEDQVKREFEVRWREYSGFNKVIRFYLIESNVIDIAERWVVYREIFEVLSVCKVAQTRKVDLISVFHQPHDLFKPIREISAQIHAIESDFKLKGVEYSSDEQAKFDEIWNFCSDLLALDFKIENATNSEMQSILENEKLEIMDLSRLPFSFTVGNNSVNPRKLQRIRKELITLKNSLPDGIFVRVDEQCFDKMKVMIIGAKGTPYQNGCFMFDLFLPQDYPSVPPSMRIANTVYFKFNPNLYPSGYICLSLLGTWNGQQWDPLKSTILQLLVSIQSLVMTENPILQEPSRLLMFNRNESLAYDNGIRHATVLYAMIKQLDDAPYCFKRVINAHFSTKRPEILEQLQHWESMISHPTNCKYFSWTHLFPKGAWLKNKTKLIALLNRIQYN
jgi:ubiquitin-protein ligase